MFKYFPTNYVWNLSVDLAIEMGARIGEIEAMCAPLQEAAKAPDAAGTQACLMPRVVNDKPCCPEVEIITASNKGSSAPGRVAQ